VHASRPIRFETTLLYNNQTKNSRLLRVSDQAADDAQSSTGATCSRCRLQGSRYPNNWKEYWNFWCDKVQPAYRQTTGLRGLWHRMPMGVDSSDSFF